MVGINVVDTWKLASHHRLLSYRQGKNCTVSSFSGILVKQLLVLANKYSSRETLIFEDTTLQSVSDMSSDIESLIKVNKKRKWKYLDWMTEAPISIPSDSNGGLHPLFKFPVTIGGKANKKYRKNRTCSSPHCKKLSTFFCGECGTFCHSHDPSKAIDKCYYKHIQTHTRTSV